MWNTLTHTCEKRMSVSDSKSRHREESAFCFWGSYGTKKDKNLMPRTQLFKPPPNFAQGLDKGSKENKYTLIVFLPGRSS